MAANDGWPLLTGGRLLCVAADYRWPLLTVVSDYRWPLGQV